MIPTFTRHADAIIALMLGRVAPDERFNELRLVDDLPAQRTEGLRAERARVQERVCESLRERIYPDERSDQRRQGRVRTQIFREEAGIKFDLVGMGVDALQMARTTGSLLICSNAVTRGIWQSAR